MKKTEKNVRSEALDLIIPDHKTVSESELSSDLVASLRKLIVVLGMHRSGTSAITRSLKVFGVQLGENLLPPIESDNDKGFWENVDLNTFNEEILDTLGSNWSRLTPIQSIDLEKLRSEGYFLRGLELIRHITGDESLFGIKDPRVTLLLPFWKTLFHNQTDYDVYYVITLRNPMSVAKSLHRRNGFDFEKSYLLWLGHVLTYLINTAGEKRILVDYDRLMQAPERELKRVAIDLDLEIDSDELELYKNTFLDKGLQHTVFKPQDIYLDDSCPPLVREVYLALTEIVSGKKSIEDPAFRDLIDLWVKEFDRYIPLLKYVDKLFFRIDSIERSLSDQEQQISSLNQIISDRDYKIGEQSLKIDEQVRIIDEQVRIIDEQVRIIDESSIKIDELNVNVGNLNRTIDEQNRKLDMQSLLLGEREKELRFIYQSNSWKLTKPLRFIRRKNWMNPYLFFRNQFSKENGLNLQFHVNHLGRLLFRHLPLPFQIKIWLMELAFKHAGWLFRGTGRYEVWKRGKDRNRLANIHPDKICDRDLKESFESQYATHPICFPIVENPVVSVIIPAYRGLRDLQNCLRSLTVFLGTEPSFEIILIDDCPDEPVLEFIPDSGGLFKIANTENLGFLLTCNRGASLARGRYLCFLNSDTIVTAGWLRTLVEAIEETPGAAVAGSMLLNRDGSIQDAGWRIMQNGWGYPIGRGEDPLNGAYSYRHEVDCVTGACFLVLKNIFNDLKGLDAAYAPAFYEEFDFAFRVRDKGLKVIFEPRSQVVHLGSASYGAEQRDRLSTRNHAIFVERFADKLRKQPWDTTDEFLIRKSFDKGPVILFVDLSVPHPDRHAGDVTIYRYLNLFVESGWHVIFGPFDGQADDSAAEALEKQGIELIRSPWSIEGWLQEHGKHLDFVWLSRPELTETLIGSIRSHSSARLYYYTHDLHFLRFEREAKLRGGNSTLEAEEKLFLKLEKEIFNQVDLIMSPSMVESEVIKNLVPDKPVATLPPFYYEPAEIKRRNADHFINSTDIVFIGGFPHTPNIDSALFIARDVMPIVWQECPEARLVLVGYKPPPEVRALAEARVVVTGQVPDVAPFLETARVFLAPLRFGAGVKGKILQALQYGVPVVTSPIGIEGTSIQPGREALVAEDASGFAQAVISLLHDPDRCAALSAAGAKFINEEYSRYRAKTVIEQNFYLPRCGICGSKELIASSSETNFRDDLVCAGCSAHARSEALSRVILKRFGLSGESSLAELMHRKLRIRIHQFGAGGGIADTLRGWENFSTSDYFEDVQMGSMGAANESCENLSRLTFPEASFDLVISQDLMEHVSDPKLAFRNIHRMLKPGGVHVFTDFSRDLVDLLSAEGFRVFQHDIKILNAADPSKSIRVFEAVKEADNEFLNKV